MSRKARRAAADVTPEPPAVQVPTESDYNAQVAAWRADRDQRFQAIRHNGSALLRASERWAGVRDQEWHEIAAKAVDDYASGQFLLEQLGGVFYLYPELMATLLNLRQGLLDQFDGSGPAEAMLVDMAILGYFNALRVQGWIGNSATVVEAELFGQESPSVKLQDRYGSKVAGLQVEEVVQHLVEQLLPLLDRANRMMLRNLRALTDLRRPPAPTVAVNQAGQVNIATEQKNAVVTAPPAPAPRRSPHR